jgi:hypothetical protein
VSVESVRTHSLTPLLIILGVAVPGLFLGPLVMEPSFRLTRALPFSGSSSA